MSNCICIYADEVEEVISDTLPRARIPHVCGECGETIKPGLLYERMVTVYDGVLWTHKTCARCVNIRSDFFNCGWFWGRLVEDFRDHHGFDYRKGLPPDFAPCRG